MNYKGVDGRGRYDSEGRQWPSYRRRTDEDKRAASLKGLIRRCQGLAKGWPWQPPKDPLQLCPKNTQFFLIL
jgi:hypothetical protein